MTFLPNIPQGADFLDFSWTQLLSNNQGLDTIFGIDHYAFSNLTANKGFHNKITTPVFVDNPATGLPPVTTTNPVMYGFQDTAPLGVLQYSRGPSNAVPSPLTFLQSPATPVSVNNVTNPTVLDFTGITRAIANLYVVDSVDNLISDIQILWNGTVFTFLNNTGTIRAFQAPANVLKLQTLNATLRSNVYWTLQLLRIQ